MYQSAWAKFYAERNTEGYYEHVVSKYAPHIQAVNSCIRKGDRVIEFGCGLCNVTRKLALEDKKDAIFVGLDKEVEMLRLSQQNVERAGLPYNRILFYQGDARNGTLYGEVAHSHGLLEHFQDVDIRRIIDNQLGRFRNIVHYVPGAKYEKPSFGDERLMTPEQWHEICKPDEIVEFNEGYDLILRWNHV